MKKTCKNKYRISNAAVGRILTAVMEMNRSSEFDPSQFHHMMYATLTYIETEEQPLASANINPLKWQIIKEMVDKAARRSKAARERWAQRAKRSDANAATGDKSGTTIPDSKKYDVSRPAMSRETPAEKAEREKNLMIARQFKAMYGRRY